MGFVNSLASYLLLMVITVAVGAVAVFLGITLRRKSNAKDMLQKDEEQLAGGQSGV